MVTVAALGTILVLECTGNRGKARIMQQYDHSKPYRVWSERASHGSYPTATAAFNDLPRGVEMLRVTKGPDPLNEVWPALARWPGRLRLYSGL